MKSERTLVDQHQRDLAAGDLSQSYIVEAAAGTGKTTVLVSRIINLIRKEDGGLEEVVAITFTEKAAAELKAKLRQELEKALLGEPASEEYQRISEALSDLERMQVTTIHSFCGSLLRERPVEANLDPNFEVADGLMARLLRREIWEAWFERQMDGDGPALRRAVLNGIKTDQIFEMARSLIENRDVLGYLPSPQPPEEMGKAIARFIQTFQEELASLNSLKQYCRHAEDRALLTIEELDGILRKIESISVREEKERFIYKEFRIETRGKGSKTNWRPDHQLTRVREHVDSILGNLKEIRATISESILADLSTCLTGYVEAYQQAKQERNLLDFHDLLLYTSRMLKRHPEVRKYFRNRYRFLLVDEFQDTDPLQAEIVFFLSEEERSKASEWREVRVAPKRLFLVGDPKQSIYRFRRADIEMYEEAKARMGKGRLLTISQNFRCAPSIVRVANRVFQNLIKPPEDGPYQPGYVPLYFGRKEETVPPMHGIILLYPPDKKKILMNNADEHRRWESRCVASFIQRLVNEERRQVWDEADQSFRPVMFKDIAILMRTYKPLNYLEEALRPYGVNYRVIGGRHFYQRQEVQQLLTVLKSVDNPNDRVSLIGALRSPFFGVSDEEIFLFHARGGDFNYLSSASGTDLEKPFGLLKELHEMRNRVSVSILLQKLYEATKGLVLFLLKPQGEQRVANLLKIGDMARALDERGVLSFRGFVRWLSERQEEVDEEEEPPTLERGDNFVRILTIHKAKGLEFPVVILTDLGRKGNGRENFIIDRSVARIAIKVGDQKSRCWTRHYEELREWEEKRGEAEEKRLLYVGMTRARDFLALPVYWVKENKEGKKDIPAGSFLRYLQPYLVEAERVSFGKRDQEMMVYDTNQLNLAPEDQGPFQYPINLERRNKKEICSSLSQFNRWKEAQEELKRRGRVGRTLTTAVEKIEEVERNGEWATVSAAGNEGVTFGKLVHRLFERLDWSRPGLLEKMAEIEGKELGATRPMIKKAGEVVKEALGSPLLRRAMASGDYQKEVPFGYQANGTIVEGVMDVVFREGDGLVVLDFKTDLVKREDLHSKKKHYQPQANVYSNAVRAIFGQRPKEVVLFFLHLMEPVSI